MNSLTRPFYFDEQHQIKLVDAVGTLCDAGLEKFDGEARLIMTLEEAGTYERLAPVMMDLQEALPDTKYSVDHCFAQLTQWHQAVQLIELANCAVTGQGAVITNRRHLVKESVLEFVAHNRAPDGFTVNRDQTYNVTAKHAKFIQGGCLLAKRPWYQNYGHWLVDNLAVIALTAELIQINKWKIVIGKVESAGLRQVIHDGIQMVLPNIEIELLEHPDNEIWYFDQLFYVTPPHVPPLFKSPTAISKIREFAEQSITVSNRRRRLLVSRSTSSFRRLDNEAEVFDALSAYGFELVHPEKLSFEEQVKLFSEAEVIAGAKGAALTNCMFAPRGMKVLVFSPSDFPDAFFWDFIAQLDGRYAEIYGAITTEKHQSHNNFVVKIDACLQALDALGVGKV